MKKFAKEIPKPHWELKTHSDWLETCNGNEGQAKAAWETKREGRYQAYAIVRSHGNKTMRVQQKWLHRNVITYT